MSSKIGRPTTNPKNERITIRLDENSQNLLLEYCEKKSVGRAEAIRIAIGKLKSDIE